MTYKKAYAIPGLVLAAGSIALAAMVTPAEPEVAESMTIPATPAPIMLACGPDYVTTMGESTAGIEQTETEAKLSSSGFALGGGAADGGTASPDGGAVTWSGTLSKISVEPGDQPGIAAGALQRIQESGELAGLAIVPCQTPSSEHLLVGGTTSLSASAELVLTSTSQTAAQVTVEVLTSTGVAPATPISTVTVGGGSTERVLIEAGVIDERIALRVTARGGRVSAFLYTHAVDGLVGTGVATVNPGEEPSTSQVIPAVMLGTEPTLRVANPGTEPATISAFIDDGEAHEIPGISDVTVAPGTVLDLSLSGLGEATTAVVVDSDQPIAAAVMSANGTDRGWMPSVSASRKLASVVPAGDVTLYAVSEGDTAAVVRSFDASGNEIGAENVTIRSGVLALPEGAAFVEIEADHPIRAGMWVSRTEGDMVGLEALPLTVPPASSTELALTMTN